ncbi:MAG: diguanylate cyclase, partial [Thiohalobacteraceae bacterium]
MAAVPHSVATAASLSTKVTVIVFWGLIVAGLVVAVLLLKDREADTRTARAALTDAIAYRLDQRLHEHGLDPAALDAALAELLGEHVEVGARIELGDRVLADYGPAYQDAGPQSFTRSLRGLNGPASPDIQVGVRFPNIDQSLHAERSRVLLSLGALLLLFGIALRKVLARVLTRPMTEMADTARRISEGQGGARFSSARTDEFGYLAQFIDEALDAVRRTELEAQRSRELAEVTLHSIGDGVITTNHNARVTYMNPVAQRLLGLDLVDVQGLFLAEVMPLVDEDTGASLEHSVLLCLRENRTVELDCATLLRTGMTIPIVESAAPIHGRQGEVRGAVVVFHDVSVARNLQRELTYQACHDPLTGLYNRREFDREVARALECGECDEQEHTLCYLDLDQFKVVNDTCGHAAGDRLLQQLTAHLRERLHKSDLLARLGGDEFGLLLTYCSLGRALEIVQELRDVVNAFRFEWAGKTFQIGVSIGVVELSPAIGTAAEALAAADMACYAAKDDGRNRVHVYRPDDAELSRRRDEMRMVSAVQRALHDGSFELFAQIIVPVREATTLPHYEILARMRDPDGEYISPGVFIAAAERFQLMAAIDRWVVSRAVQLAAIQARRGRPVELSINLSGQSLNEEQFLDFVADQI